VASAREQSDKNPTRAIRLAELASKIVTTSRDKTARIWLTPEGIIEWLKTADIYKLANEDFEELGLDFMIEK
jgi:hypothetical protein